ncbi:CTP:L-myo-inositol-1-phosphate cytidylyltransferase/di-myo-inositol-1,3-phosphate-1-phosphate synthase [Archaeoglobus sulfaticallidus PM70-1]|uniref:Bifunctional IPC transferase and DIPP synthase n=1 Tax=Archaeoglobus sulfaticallidus PM70-1 TaxID=387631 RepID=N0BK38_9EURY|nr:bifunctional L-myo-inositol-1-phosphate cytidylyltransferase/CDP-L-myo-inositol myo-inositolphosphotransferase [Archaeoglobus sulfaticallidus]AGK60866.1 CTP:L-myo-inositol-1-phosphate cytidylyltransferase/di-myo-inositol-1,3-phosphate-1-phosphate synthase [Archaeoglobus sulfaticallidus PM70-1]
MSDASLKSHRHRKIYLPSEILKMNLMKAVILSAGFGSRIGGYPKPLLKVGGIEIIKRTITLLSPHVDEFIIVAGKYYEDIKQFLEKNCRIKYRLIRNEHPEYGNGYSLLLAKDHIDGKFVLVMGDHIYSKEFVDKAVKLEGLIGDAKPAFVDVNEATKVKISNGVVEDIGKKLSSFDCIDTGFFVLDRSILDGIEFRGEELTVSDIMKKAKPKVSILSGYFWIDVDTKDDLRRANWLIVRNSVKGSGDGLVSKYINRRISTRISAMLVNSATPNMMTAISFLTGIASSLLVLFSLPLAGIAYQLSSILDGCDGEIARASLKQSRFGGYIDSILDRYVDFLFLAMLTFCYGLSYPAIFAIFGSFMVSYTSEKYRADFGRSIFSDVRWMKYLIGKRDERIFLIMLLCILGMVNEIFWAIAIITNMRVILTVLFVALNSRS